MAKVLTINPSLLSAFVVEFSGGDQHIETISLFIPKNLD